MYRNLQKKITCELEKIKRFNIPNIDDELEELILEFGDFAYYPDGNVNDFDIIMAKLYDWGDTPLDDIFGGKKVCWISTIF